MLHKVCPILPSRDFDVTEAFYGRLDFTTRYKGPEYLLLSRDEIELHFFHHPNHRPETCDHGAYLRPDDVDVFSNQVAALGLSSEPGFPRFVPAEDKPWGMREATLWDPDGTLLRAGQEVS